jgi:hypothetical protein
MTPLWFWQELWQPVLVNNRIVDDNVGAWIAHFKRHGYPSWKEWQLNRREQ